MPKSFWLHIRSLQGRVLHTVAQRKPFTVAKVTDTEASLAVHDGGRERVIRRVDLEPLWQRLVADGELDIAAIKTVYKFNSSLAAALLASAPGVKASARPITLRRRA